MLSVAEVFELVPGDEQNATWINPGFIAEVLAIETRKSKAGKSFWTIGLGDTTGDAQIGMSVFAAPKFRQGDTIEVSGQGLRRTEYNGNAQVTMGKNTEVHVVNTTSAEPTAQLAPASDRQTRGTVDTEKFKRDARAAVQSHQEQAPDNYQPPTRTPVYGATVGMAVNQAMETIRYAYTPNEMRAMLTPMGRPDFMAIVWEFASDLIRCANSLEKGNIAATPTTRAKLLAATHEATAATQAPAKPEQEAPLSKAAAGYATTKGVQPVADEDAPF